MYFDRSIEGSLKCTTLLLQAFIVMLLLLHHVYNPSNSFCRSLSVSANNTIAIYRPSLHQCLYPTQIILPINEPLLNFLLYPKHIFK